MKFLVIACLAALAPAVHASANFKLTCNQVNGDFTSLAKSIAQIKSIARGLGHLDIVSKCEVASSHIQFAQSSWAGISSGFLSFPWQARSSPHAQNVKVRLSSCGNILDQIYSSSRITLNKQYHPVIPSCQKNFQSCQTGCQSIWNWPSPPNNAPRPTGGFSGDYGGYGGYGRRHKRQESLCPSEETACPISDAMSGIECLDTQSELTSCGGCVSKGEGQNCLLIPGAEGVGCQEGSCIVFSTKSGYTLNESGLPKLVSA